MLSALRGKLIGEGLAARARRGSIFVVMKFGGKNLVRLISNLVLTRLLFPEAFGLMALVQVFLSGLKMFSDVGVKASIVQHERGDDPVFIHTAWTVQVLRGVVLALIVVLAAPYVGAFYEEPLLAPLLTVAALGLVIDGFVPARALVASRHLVIGRLMAIQFGCQVVIVIITIGLAWAFQSVWALVAGNLIGGVLRNLMIRVFMPGIRDRFALDMSALRDLVGFGAFVLVATAAAFISSSGDRAILGKFVPLDVLGIYTVAFTLAAVPLELMRAFGSKIVFPLYSRRPPHESDENRRKLFRARFLLTGSVFAAAAVMIVFGDPLMRLLYDSRYALGGGMLVLIAIGLLPSLIVGSYEFVLLSNNRSDLHALLVICQGGLRAVALLAGIIHFGILGAALAPAVATILQYPVMVGLTKRYRAWDPLHDAVFLALSIALVALGWWLHTDAVLAVPRG
jgi:O-antigen/teichoic acid export membrane protein